MLAFQCRTKSLSLPFQVNLAGFLDSSGRAFFNYISDFTEETLIYRLMIFFLFSKGNAHDHIHQIFLCDGHTKKVFFFTLNEFIFWLVKDYITTKCCVNLQ